MSDFRTVRGFEEVWRPPVRPRHLITPATLRLGPSDAGQDVRARLARVAGRAPEVMVKVTGRTRDPGALRAHLDYISRNGQLDMEDRDGAVLAGRAEVKDLADGWSAAALADSQRRANAPLSLSLMLSMPAGTDAAKVRDAARAFAADVFASEHDYVFALHTDAPHPHVHMAVCSRGDLGSRLNPKKADLEHWRQVFAQKLRDRGVEAEATPRRARGVTRKPERQALRKLRERHEAGQGAMSRVRRAAYAEAARAAFQGDTTRRAWERRVAERQAVVRQSYLAQASLLGSSADPRDRELGARVEAFVRSMPAPDSQRLDLARELRAANQAISPDRHPDGRERRR